MLMRRNYGRFAKGLFRPNSKSFRELLVGANRLFLGGGGVETTLSWGETTL